jgi:hypothetical protein
MSVTQKELLERLLIGAETMLRLAKLRLHTAEEDVAEAQNEYDYIIGELQEIEHEEAEA